MYRVTFFSIFLPMIFFIFQQKRALNEERTSLSEYPRCRVLRSIKKKLKMVFLCFIKNIKLLTTLIK